jgi:hypothetical protein
MRVLRKISSNTPAGFRHIRLVPRRAVLAYPPDFKADARPRHAFNGNLLYTPVLQRGSRVLRYLVNGNRIAVIATIQSGDVFNMGSNRVLNGDPSTASTFQRPLFIGRNTLRAPRTSEFDVRYTRLFPIRERMKLEFIAESTNIFNRTNVVGLNSTATVDAAGNIVAWPSLAWTAALDQRLVQLGFKFSF